MAASYESVIMMEGDKKALILYDIFHTRNIKLTIMSSCYRSYSIYHGYTVLKGQLHIANTLHAVHKD
jgi:hypothetical protein